MTHPLSPPPADLQLPEGFRFTETLHPGSNSIVYRAVTASGRTVVLKQLRDARPSLLRLARYHNEADLGRDHGVDGVVHATALHRVGRSLAIEFEDIGAKAIALTLAEGLPTVDQALEVTEAVARQLTGLHAAGIVHRDVNPSNIVRVSTTGQVQLIDLGIATRRPADVPVSRPPDQLEGTLAYISPEQTGRMNRAVDSRTDIYALGCTLFELLTGQPPFRETDLFGLVHAHIAKPPPTPTSLRPELPEAVDALVARMLEKSPDQRYQSAAGVLADIRHLRARLAQGHTRPFPLATDDHATELRPASRLVGRESQLSQLMDAFERARSGGSALVLVRGPSGIGKSALVNEVHAPITAAHGLFLSGKFDQLQRGAALGALGSVLSQLAMHVRAWPSAVSDPWVATIRAAVGPAGAVLNALSPDARALLGDLPPVETLPGPESQHRLHRACIDLFRCVARPERPLVLFLDDLQWADPASMRLLEALLTTDDLGHILVVGAYRDHEVPRGHLLEDLAPRLERAGVDVHAVGLQALDQVRVIELVADILGHPASIVAPLGAIVHRRTHGNPFFVFQFLQALRESSALGLSPTTGRWRWDVQRISRQAYTENVVELLVQRLANIPPEARHTLAVAACIGNTFEVGLLARASGRPTAEVVAHLEPAIHLGLVQPLDVLPLRSGAALTEHPDTSCRFVHDRVQQAAVLPLDTDARTRAHRDIGRALLAEAARVPDTFTLAGHLQRAAPLIDRPDERRTHAEILHQAARLALESAASDSAADFARAALELLADDPTLPDHTFTLRLLAAVAATRAGRFVDADAHHAVLERTARGPDDRVAAGVERLDQFLMQGRYAEGVQAGLACLALLGVDIPRDPATVDTDLDALHAEMVELLGDRSVIDLLHAPRMTDPRMELAVRLWYGVFMCAYLGGQGAIALLWFAHMALLSARHGNCALSAYGYTGYGMVLTVTERDFALGRAYGELGVALCERFDDISTRCKTNFFFAADVQDWTGPIRHSQPYFKRALDLALQCGDWTVAGYVGMQSGSDQLTSGQNLAELATWLEGQLAFLQRKSNHEACDIIIAGVYRPVLHLLGRTDGWDTFDGDGFSSAAYEAHHDGHGFHLAWLWASGIRAAWLRQDRASYPLWAGRISTIESFVPSHSKVPEAAMFAALMRIALIEDQPDHASTHRAEVDRLLERLRRWADACPENVRARVLLVEAECARLEGRLGVAVERYEAARVAASDARAPNVEALICEAHAGLWRSRGRTAMAAELMREAAWLYERWGAVAKVAALEAARPEAFKPTTTIHGLTFQGSTGGVVDATIDAAAVVRAARAISSEVELPALLARLLDTVLAHSGAQRAVLVMQDDQLGWTVRAETSARGEPPRDLRVPLDTDDAALLVPRGLVHLVLDNPHTVRISDALLTTGLEEDPFVHTHQVRSLLCLPLQGQGRLEGVLVLTHHQSAGAFDPSHASVLEHLSTQIAIALANATLFAQVTDARASLEQRVVERTRELRGAMSQLRSAQDELVRSARLASLGTLVSGVAHELNTPLGIALTARDILLEAVDTLDTDPRAADRVRQAAGLIGSNVERAANLIQSFKGFAVDQVDNHERLISVGDYLHSVLQSLVPLTRKHLLEVDLRVPKADVVLRCAPGRLGQLLTNVLDNAGLHAYGGAGGPVRVVLEDSEDNVALIISDDGAGMPATVAAQCFVPFYTTRRDHGGSGIGLAIVHAIVAEDMGGSVDLHTTPGGGTTFTFRLPRRGGAR